MTNTLFPIAITSRYYNIAKSESSSRDELKRDTRKLLEVMDLFIVMIVMMVK